MRSDDVIARCDTRDAGDLVGGIGGPNVKRGRAVRHFRFVLQSPLCDLGQAARNIGQARRDGGRLEGSCNILGAIATDNHVARQPKVIGRRVGINLARG